MVARTSSWLSQIRRAYVHIAGCVLVAGASVLAFAGYGEISGCVGVLALSALAGGMRLPDEERGARDAAERLRRSVESGKRLAIYDHETGLFAEWYLTMRVREECERALRYAQPFSLILIETGRSPENLVDEDDLLGWIRAKKRSVDLAGYLGPGRLILALPSTDTAGARKLLRRMRGASRFRAAVAEATADGVTIDDLYGSLEQRLTHSHVAGGLSRKPRTVDPTAPIPIRAPVRPEDLEEPAGYDESLDESGDAALGDAVLRHAN